MGYFIFLIVVLIICIWAGGVIFEKKGRKRGNGQGLGCLLGPLGVLIAALLPENPKGVEERELESGENKKCPFCAEIIKAEAKICKHCGKEQEILEKYRLFFKKFHWNTADEEYKDFIYAKDEISAAEKGKSICDKNSWTFVKISKM
ncbi:MAG: hypothetical protein AUJ85_07490 [Elusimicrobia bacterium CG1_02_37_114]|nr:MAG: hypothetical protein AUJ85_07490 [Elusimicrobia bacterium CG1_02_37_114]PIV52635.1 MAG: hypothetical protein COS17_08055 [Elusimicrobia bacterium CG02_land_8_20_14_3_00_37_13]PIZ13098.1 MAG: hypothetical protein COY53_06485 [Elusimicrobia bacterium CG_4_10_14_0_8_um_filter_37_32]